MLDKTIIQPLQSLGATVWIFGSRARGDHKAASDVDILYELPAGIKLPAGFLFSIKSDIEESRFPYIVELVDLKDLADSYRDGVMRDRTQI